MTSIRSRLVLLLGLLSVIAFPRTTLAATTYACSEAGLDAALKNGGASTFSCAAATTITVTSSKTIIQSGTSIDGGGRFVLSGGDAVIPLVVAAGVNATLTGFTIENGHGPAAGYGGNLVVNGTLTMTDSTSRGGGSYGGGSGIYVEGGGSLTLSRSTVSGGRGTDGGQDGEGAITVHGSATITGSTVTDGVLRGIGARFGGGVTIVGSTVVTTRGEALFVSDADSHMSVTSSLLVTSPGYPGAQNNGTLVSGGYNLLDVDTSPAKQIAQATDIVGVTPLLGALADNGGPTQTRALLACSPGINAGPVTSASATDQRGQARVQKSATDIGAYESALLPCFQAADVSVSEGNAGTTAVTFSVSLSGRSTLATSVGYATADGTATTADKDYTATSGTLAFAAGDTTATITVLANGDTRNEANETFFLNLSAGANASVSDAQAQATLQNDDALPSLSIGDISVGEGDVGTTPATFTVSLSAASGQTVTVAYATANGTATAGSDYAATSGTLTFAPGTTTQSIPVTIDGDVVREGDETFKVTLSAPSNATLGRASGTGTILDNETTPGLVIGSASVSEGNAGTTPVSLTVVLGTLSATPVTVDWATVDGTATAGEDYTAGSGTLTFAPGETSKTITLAIAGDTTVEADESFTVHLSNAVGAEIGTANGTVTITNDDFTAVENDAGVDAGDTMDDAGAPVDASASDASLSFGDSGISFAGADLGDSNCDCAMVGTSSGGGSAGALVCAGLALAFARARRRRKG